MIARTALLAAAIAAFGCGGPTGPVLPDAQRGPMTRAFDIAAGEFAELNLKIEANVEITVTHAGSVPFEWNVHSHPGGEVVIHEQGVSANESVSFTPAQTGLYSYLWTNPSNAVAHLQIDTDLPPGSSLDSWHPQ